MRRPASSKRAAARRPSSRTFSKFARGIAYAELDTKTLGQIQHDTAIKWAWRAWAALEHARRATSERDITKWRMDASEYEHEALEHAALASDDENDLSLFKTVRRIIKRGV